MVKSKIYPKLEKMLKKINLPFGNPKYFNQIAMERYFEQLPWEIEAENSIAESITEVVNTYGEEYMVQNIDKIIRENPVFWLNILFYDRFCQKTMFPEQWGDSIIPLINLDSFPNHHGIYLNYNSHPTEEDYYKLISISSDKFDATIREIFEKKIFYLEEINIGSIEDDDKDMFTIQIEEGKMYVCKTQSYLERKGIMQDKFSELRKISGKKTDERQIIWRLKEILVM